jgi:hypothetical protein
MTDQEKWEKEVEKIHRLSKFNKNAKIILLVTGVVITILVIVLYNYQQGPLQFDNLTVIKTIIVAFLLGFGASSAITGMISSLYAGSINLNVLNNPPNANDYRKVKELLPKLEKAKEEMKHYFQISAVILLLNVLKDIIDLFIIK